MRTLLNPRWILILNTLPIVLIILLFGYQFELIKVFLADTSIQQWKFTASLVAGLVCFSGMVALYHIYGKKLLTPLYALICLLVYTAFLYYFSENIRTLIPRSVPNWKIIDDTFVLLSTALMPTLAHALLILIIWLTPEKKEYSGFLNFLMSLMVPAIWYVFNQIISPLWNPTPTRSGTHTLMILAFVVVVIFMFFLVRSFYIVISRWANYSDEVKNTYFVLFTFVFPIAGLLLNSTLLIFGNFSSPWFYALAVLNSIFLCLHTDNIKWRLLLLLGKSITLPFSVYFFLLFLPYLPLSLVAVVLLGIGLLMLTPLILFPIHINSIQKDLVFLSKSISKKYLYLLVLIGCLSIPLILTINYLGHKQNLHKALNHLYHSDYSQPISIDKSNLKQTLDAVRGNNMRSQRILGVATNAPYIGVYYNWLVLDNLSLSREKIERMENIFLGIQKEKNNFRRRPFVQRKDAIELSNYKVTSQFDAQQGAYKSWVDLELTNQSNRNNAEYTTTIELPTGAWISDYYLYVGDRKDYGLLSEKRAATWIYTSIRNIRKDPGILYYLGGNNIRFKVFPFSKDEVRKTGFEIIHKEPFKLEIDGKARQLGNKNSDTYGFENENILYLTSTEKSQLNKTVRAPYFHYIVDSSAGADVEYQLKKIDNFIASQSRYTNHKKITFADLDHHTTSSIASAREAWQNLEPIQSREAGFFIDRAIKKILFESYKENTSSYPIIVVATDKDQLDIPIVDTRDWAFTLPEGVDYYMLNYECDLYRHSCLLYTSPSPRDATLSRMPSSA